MKALAMRAVEWRDMTMEAARQTNLTGCYPSGTPLVDADALFWRGFVPTFAHATPVYVAQGALRVIGSMPDMPPEMPVGRDLLLFWPMTMFFDWIDVPPGNMAIGGALVEWLDDHLVIGLFVQTSPDKFQAMSVMGWRNGARIDTATFTRLGIFAEHDKEDIVGFSASVIQTLMFMRSRIPLATIYRKDRVETSQGLLSVPDRSTVQVIALRSYERVAVAEDGHAVDWSHRWFVRAHHRTLPDARSIIVRGHIKGPADKPLVLRDRIYDVRR